MDKVISNILRKNPSMVGFTCYDKNYYFIKLITRTLKKVRSDLPIIVGGPSATFNDMLIMEDNPAIDICVRFSGEKTALELVKRVRAKDSYAGVAGITYRDGKKGIVRDEDRIWPDSRNNESLDDIPSPYISGVIPPEKQVGILTARGCIYRCGYCSFSTMAHHKIHYHSEVRVIEELKYIAERNRGAHVVIHDDAFSINVKRAKDICRKIIEDNIQLSFSCITRADSIDMELVELMRGAGFGAVSIGLESSVPEELNIIRKVEAGEKEYIEKTRYWVNIFSKYGINCAVSVIFGIPGQDLASAERTIQFIEDISPKVYSHNWLALFRGTRFFQERNKYGIDVVNSETVLPYKTVLSYDVEKVRRLPQASDNLKVSYTANMVKNIIAVNSPYFIEKNRIYAAVIDKNFGLLEMFSEIGSRMILSPVILALNSSAPVRQKELIDLIRKGFPAVNVITGKKRGNMQDLYFITELTQWKEREITKFMEIYFVPLVKFRREAEKIDKTKSLYKQVIFLTLETHADAEKFMSILGTAEFIGSFSKYRNIEIRMAQECRWHDGGCPALERTGYYAKDVRSFCPVARHVNFGSLDELAEFWEQEHEKMRLRRGCDSCVVNDSCSKCLYPTPLSEEEYCGIRRTADTAGYIKRLRVYDNLQYRSCEKLQLY